MTGAPTFENMAMPMHDRGFVQRHALIFFSLNAQTTDVALSPAKSGFWGDR
jgi:hypothetical protein